jgi:hypothetical protein
VIAIANRQPAFELIDILVTALSPSVQNLFDSLR